MGECPPLGRSERSRSWAPLSDSRRRITASVTRFPRGVPCPIWACIGHQSVRAAACSAPLMTSAAWACG
eukprot:3315000-Pyramimonas_sp.AAC.1